MPGRSTFEAGRIPGADFLDLQGEFSDNTTRLRFMMPPVPQLEAASSIPSLAALIAQSFYMTKRTGSGIGQENSAEMVPVR
jgi:hypothetical protein